MFVKLTCVHLTFPLRESYVKLFVFTLRSSQFSKYLELNALTDPNAPFKVDCKTLASDYATWTKLIDYERNSPPLPPRIQQC